MALQQEDLKTLDQTRQRLSQLANNIASLKSDIQQGSPLPPWYLSSQHPSPRLCLSSIILMLRRESIQTSAAILGNNINSIVEQLSRNADSLNRTVVYSSTNYPGRTQEGLLGQLLRKKLEPQVESWVDEGRKIQESTKQEAPGDRKGDEDIEELWEWGKDWIGGRVATYILEEAGDSYTAEEREMGIENVNIGLRRKPDEEDSDEDEDEDDDEDKEMKDVGVEVTSVGKVTGGQLQFGLEEVRKSPDGKARGINDILRFATSHGEQNHPIR
jgi:mediator of RNA polymerase II transcription subunit 8